MCVCVWGDTTFNCLLALPQPTPFGRLGNFVLLCFNMIFEWAHVATESLEVEEGGKTLLN